MKKNFTKNFTKKQGQYLAFIYHYKKLNKQSPAFLDFQKYFKSDPASVNSMIKKLEEKELLSIENVNKENKSKLNTTNE